MGERMPISAAVPRLVRRPPHLFTLIVVAFWISACAAIDTTPLAEKDRFQRFNQASYNLHDRIDRAVIKPVARGYDALPDKIQNRTSNFFANLHGPIDITNNLLQGKFKRGFSGIGRLLVNSTIGLGGLFDPAARMGMPQYREDLGQTLATWGVPSGPYVFVPIIGPTTVRDLFGRVGDWQYDPISQNDDTSTRNTLVVGREIDNRAELLTDAIEGTIDRASNPYARVRSMYDQSRRDAIFDGNPPDPFAEDFE